MIAGLKYQKEDFMATQKEIDNYSLKQAISDIKEIREHHKKLTRNAVKPPKPIISELMAQGKDDPDLEWTWSEQFSWCATLSDHYYENCKGYKKINGIWTYKK